MNEQETVARIHAIHETVEADQWDHEQEDSFSAMADLLEQLPMGPLRIETALAYEICPVHLCDEAICADDGETECAVVRGR